jgi:hypothetical protein
MSERVIIHIGGQNPLLLQHVRRSRGVITRAEVVNGGWVYRQKDGKCEARDHSRAVSTWDLDPRLEETPVPEHLDGDYDEIINEVLKK